MKYEDYKKFLRSHHLVNNIYDMLYYFKIVKEDSKEELIKKFLEQRLEDIVYVESLAKYFERKLKKYDKVPDIRCNLLDLINDLNYLKQYLV